MKAIEILRLIYEQKQDIGINPNAIYRQTTIKNKNETYKILRLLQRAGLVNTIRVKPYKQKRFKVLTKLGYSFMDLREDIHTYNRQYGELKQEVKQKFSSKYCSNPTAQNMKNILLSEIYNESKTSEYKEPFKRIYLLMSILSPQYNIDIILIRYIELLSQPRVIKNSTTREILNKIVIDLLSEQISLVQKKELAEYTSIQHESFTDYLALKKFVSLLVQRETYRVKEITNIDKMVNDVMYSIFNITKVPIEKIHTLKDQVLAGDQKLIKASQKSMQEIGENRSGR